MNRDPNAPDLRVDMTLVIRARQLLEEAKDPYWSTLRELAKQPHKDPPPCEDEAGRPLLRR